MVGIADPLHFKLWLHENPLFGVVIFYDMTEKGKRTGSGKKGIRNIEFRNKEFRNEREAMNLHTGGIRLS